MKLANEKNGPILLKAYRDAFGNSAKIFYEKAPAYKGGPISDCFTLALFADYRGGDVYHISCYETIGDAKIELKKYSCGSFK